MMAASDAITPELIPWIRAGGVLDLRDPAAVRPVDLEDESIDTHLHTDVLAEVFSPEKCCDR